jgi:hypothetical protein
MRGGRLHRQLAGQDDLLDGGRADALDSRGNDPLVALRRVPAEDPGRGAWVRVRGREGAGAQRAEPAGGALQLTRGVGARLEKDRGRQEGALRRADDRDLRHDGERRRQG